MQEPEDLDSILGEYKGLLKNCKLKFEGLKKETEEGLIKIVEYLGAKITDDAPFIFTDIHFFKSDEDKQRKDLYSVVFFFDCLAENKILNPNQYRFFHYFEEQKNKKIEEVILSSDDEPVIILSSDDEPEIVNVFENLKVSSIEKRNSTEILSEKGAKRKCSESLPENRVKRKRFETLPENNVKRKRNDTLPENNVKKKRNETLPENNVKRKRYENSLQTSHNRKHSESLPTSSFGEFLTQFGINVGRKK